MIGRKAQIEDFGELLLTSAIIIILAVALVFFINQEAERKQEGFDRELAILEASQTTRMMLQHEVEPGRKLYEEIIELVNSDALYRTEYDGLFAEMETLFYEYHASSGDSEYFFRVGRHERWKEARRAPTDATRIIPNLIIPNPEGDNIPVLIFEVKDIHHTFEADRILQDRPRFG